MEQAGDERITGDAELQDVPKDGKTVGEIVTRGNITMKEVHAFIQMNSCSESY